MQHEPKIQTYRIELSRECPSVEPVDRPFAYRGEFFSVEELKIVGEALDAGVFDQDEFVEYCTGKWQLLHPAIDVCVTSEFEGGARKLSGDFAERRQVVNHYKEQLKDAPRGTWALLYRDWNNGERDFRDWTAVMAKGNGEAVVPNQSGLQGRPSFEAILKRQADYEIYCARQAEQTRREQARSRDTIRRYAWSVGTKVKDVAIGAHDFSTIQITAIHKHGPIEILGTKRGSSRRWTATVLAQAIRLKHGQQHTPAYGQITCKAA